MCRLCAGLLLALGLLTSCTQRAEAVRAARPHLEAFAELRERALRLLELRSDIERKKLLFEAANGGEDALPDNLKPVLEQMRAQNVELSEAQLEEGEALFSRMLDTAFADQPDVLQAEIAFLERDGSVSTFRYPRAGELPAGVRWFGLREQRTFSAVADCFSDDGSTPCVLLQRRPRDYAGSAGLTVAFRRMP